MLICKKKYVIVLIYYNICYANQEKWFAFLIHILK